MTPRRNKRAGSKNEEAEVKKLKAGPAVGDPCPDFELETDVSGPDKAHRVSLKEMVKDNGVVIFFYPRANTPGCTTQACGFLESTSDFEDAGYKIYGMSADKPRSQANWKKKYQLQYTLLCDPSYETLEKLGVLKPGKKIARSHMVIEKGGIIKSLEIGISPKNSYTGALKTVREKTTSPAPNPDEESPGQEEGVEKEEEIEEKNEDAADETAQEAPAADGAGKEEEGEEASAGEENPPAGDGDGDEDEERSVDEKVDGNGVEAEATVAA